MQLQYLKDAQTIYDLSYKTDGSAGFDIAAVEETIIFPWKQIHEVTLVHTGLHTAFLAGYELQIRQRSGVSLEYPNYLANGVGTIDSDYRGEIMIPVVNWTNKPWLIFMNERIAQGILSPIVQVNFEDRTRFNKLPETVRGTGGFGSTGRK